MPVKENSIDEINTKIETLLHTYNIGDIFNSVEEIRSNNKSPISTGILNIDTILDGGFYNGRLYFIGGQAGTGKTTLCVKIAKYIAETNKAVFYFPLEMSKHSIAIKILAEEIKRGTQNPITYNTLCTSSSYEALNKNDKDYIKDCINRLSANCNTLKIIDDKHNIEDIIGLIKEYDNITEATGRTDAKPVIFIDYLQYIGTTQQYATDYQKYNIIIEGLKMLVNNGYTVICPMSNNRESNKSKDGAGLSSGKGTGDIEYTCDALLQIKYDDGKRTITLCKDRYNGTFLNKEVAI